MADVNFDEIPEEIRDSVKSIGLSKVNTVTSKLLLGTMLNRQAMTSLEADVAYFETLYFSLVSLVICEPSKKDMIEEMKNLLKKQVDKAMSLIEELQKISKVKKS